MTVQEWLNVTQVKKLKFLTGTNRFEEINAVNEKWKAYNYPPTLRKWLDCEIHRIFIDSKGIATIHTIGIPTDES